MAFFLRSHGKSAEKRSPNVTGSADDIIFIIVKEKKHMKSKKSALLLSFTSLLICFAMLVGSTFAWFTDTATTGVNQIKSGTLDVDIVDAEDTTKSLDKQTLQWVRAKDGTGEKETVDSAEILWEPGCTYQLQSFRIANKGNLALKYKIQITGIQGDAKLNEVIEWKINGEDINLTEKSLLAGTASNPTYSDPITITGHMLETANNDYQNLFIDGIGITVYATQDTVENDSYGPNYDKDATYYPVLDAAGLKDALVNGGNIKVDDDVDTGKDVMIATKDTTLDMNGKTIKNTEDIWTGNGDDGKWSLISARDGANLTITGNGTFKAKENDAFAVDVQDGATVTIEDGTFIGNLSAVYVEEGTAIIEGGFFDIQQKEAGTGEAQYKFMLNCLDENYKNDKAKIIVYGGTFVNYDPSRSDSENPRANFVAEGYSVISEQHGTDTWYTVVKGTGVVPGTQEELNNGITNSAKKDVTVVMPANSSFTLDNDIANDGDKSRNITFVGDGSQTVDVVTNAITAEGGELNYQRGSSFTFENLTVQAGEGNFDGIVCDELTYKDCTIKGKLTLYGKATFINCTFENEMANQYSIWTWGGTDVTFDGCTFNTNGKAILLYGKATAEKPTNLTVNDCEFNDRKNGAADKAAIEIGNDYGATYTLNVENVKVNGFADGKNTGSKIWANKNSMDDAHLTVTIDGVKVQ